MSFPKSRKKNRNLLPKRTTSVNLDTELISALDRAADERRTCRSAVVADVLAKALLTRASRAPGADDDAKLPGRDIAKIAIVVTLPGYAPRTYETYTQKNRINASLREIAEKLTIEP